MKTRAILIAALALTASGASAGHFVEAGGSAKASVSITEDGCTASVLFDDARVHGPGDPREQQSLLLPLRVVGASDVSVEARGFAAGRAEATAILSTRQGEETLFDSDFADEPNWSSTAQLDEFRGRIWLELTLDAETAETDTELGVDSIDLSIADCVKDD